jgi:hypothetical protein
VVERPVFQAGHSSQFKSDLPYQNYQIECKLLRIQMVEILKFVGLALVSAAVVTGLLGVVLNALIKWSRSKGAKTSLPSL